MRFNNNTIKLDLQMFNTERLARAIEQYLNENYTHLFGKYDIAFKVEEVNGQIIITVRDDFDQISDICEYTKAKVEKVVFNKVTEFGAVS